MKMPGNDPTSRDAPGSALLRTNLAVLPIPASPRAEDREMAEAMDAELQAIAILLATLQPLDSDARTRVINYVFEKLGIGISRHGPPSPVGQIGHTAVLEVSPPSCSPSAPPPASASAGAADIQSLRESKNPKTVAEMVALVAYYLAHLAPPTERSDTIAPNDIKKYFVQANFPLPKAPPGVTLVNTKNAGYLESRGDGRYSLNAVGHNLVAHKLPVKTEPLPTRSSRKKARGKKNNNKARTKGRK